MSPFRKCSWPLPRVKYAEAEQVFRRCFGGCLNKAASGEKNQNYLERPETGQKMPEDRGIPYLRTVSWLISTGGGVKLHEYVDRRHKELGPVYRDCFGPVPAIFVNSPNEYRRIFYMEGPTPRHFVPEAWLLYNKIRNCRRGLLFTDGEEWLHLRRIMNKVILSSNAVKLMIKPCQSVAESLMRKWKIYADTRTVVPKMELELYQWSIQVMLTTLMGPSLSSEQEKKFRDQSVILADILRSIFFYSVRLSGLPAEFSMRMNLSWWTKFVKCIDDAVAILHVLIPKMVQLKGDGLLHIMMEEGLRDEDLTRIVTDLIIAAGDTTAYSMQWAIFLLASHPEVQDKLYESVKNLDEESILQNAFLKGVIKESLRLYPTAPFLTRYLAEDNTIGGYRVSKEDLLLLSLYSSGRDPTNFTRPAEFWPERWLRTEKGDYDGVINPHAMLPFAMGARSCVGRKLGETQLSLAIAELVKNFRMQCVNQERVKMILHLISVPSESIQLTLSKR